VYVNPLCVVKCALAEN